MTEVVENEGGSEVGAAGPTGFFAANGSSSSLKQAVLEYKLVMMNKQENLGLGLGHVKYRKYGNPVPIKTVGNKGSVELRGPPAAPQRSRAKSIAKGIKDVASAGAAVPVAALGHLGGLAGLRPGSPERRRREELLSESNRSLSARHSMIGDTVADVVSTEPGTMLVRLTSAASMPTTERKQRRRASVRRLSTCERNNRSAGSIPKVEEIVKEEHLPDSEAQAALQAMQQVPETPIVESGVGEGFDPSKGVGSHGSLHVRSSLGHDTAGGEGAAAAGVGTSAESRHPQTIYEDELKRASAIPSPVSRATHARMMAPVEGQSPQEVAELAAFEAQGKLRLPSTK